MDAHSTTLASPVMGTLEWKEAVRFDSTDWGWIIMSIGMAIGAGIVFLPVQVGLMGLWVFLLSAVIGYPAMYMFQRLFINTLATSPECKDYPSVITGYLGKNWGVLLGALYFVMLVIWVFVYSTAITNDSASFLQSFGVTDGLLSENPLYGLVLICGLVALASRGENLLFKISTFMVLTKISVVAVLGLMMVDKWDAANITAMPAAGDWMKDAIIMLPFTLTSILFIQSLSPMVISYRSREKSLEVARFKAMRAMNIAFGILFVVVFFYAVSFTLAMGHDQAVKASEENISALAMVAQGMPGQTLKLLSLTLNIFAVMTAYFGVYLGFREACQGLAMNLLRRVHAGKPHQQRIGRQRDHGVYRHALLGCHRAQRTGTELHLHLQPHLRHGGLPHPGLSGLSGTGAAQVQGHLPLHHHRHRPAALRLALPGVQLTVAGGYPLIDHGSPSGGPFSIGAADGAPARK